MGRGRGTNPMMAMFGALFGRGGRGRGFRGAQPFGRGRGGRGAYRGGGGPHPDKEGPPKDQS